MFTPTIPGHKPASTNSGYVTVSSNISMRWPAAAQVSHSFWQVAQCEAAHREGQEAV